MKTLSLLSTIALPLAVSGNTLVKRSSGVASSGSDASGQTFDYIVVGGGLAGTTVAARLAENASMTVLLIEAGGDNRTSPLVYDIYKYGQAFGTSLCWNWRTESGKGILGGKTLGGGSSINGATWTRGMKAQYDAMASLLDPADANSGWDWNGLFTYMKKAEGYSAPNTQQKAKGAGSVASYHGTAGPVQVTFPDAMYGGPQQPDFATAIRNLTGIAQCTDLNGGNPNCVAYIPNSINWHDNDHRSSSAAAYLTPVESQRTNWLTLVNNQVTKIIFSGGPVPVTATGVSYRASSGAASYTAFARREVIVASGAIQTPALLQLSGIGDAAHLGALGIDSVVDLPGVGRNLQEQTMSQFGAGGRFDPNGSGPSDIIAYPNIDQVFGGQANAVKQTISSSLGSWAGMMASAGSVVSRSALEEIYAVQAGLITNGSVPVVEMFLSTGYPNALGIQTWNLLPFSRGTVSITKCGIMATQSADPFTPPAVNANFFKVSYDMQVQVAASKLSRKTFQTTPLSNILTGEQTPGTGTVPASATDTQWTSWIQSNFLPVSHPIGTAALMRRELGGVVDAQLRVYNTTDVRVVDASVLPLQISAHLSATLYGIAEKAADIIKAAQA
ncbi:hypothetical protein K488DRAFT_70648 [Vararia minispora EC-137]|uniref:Uncharacterized protein n=1 Tax=Vararia minispora EC-137 TaxID=1314806 RepID=A0ACB8QKS0_9AGAM|nr:hypothetical protein K488DRAFT_70648 [Vararia minispora EC-137]